MVEKYEKNIGRLTNLPIYLKVDQSFSYLYVNFSKGTVGVIGTVEEQKYWMLSEDNNSTLWNEF